MLISVECARESDAPGKAEKREQLGATLPWRVVDRKKVVFAWCCRVKKITRKKRKEEQEKEEREREGRGRPRGRDRRHSRNRLKLLKPGSTGASTMNRRTLFSPPPPRSLAQVEGRGAFQFGEVVPYPRACEIIGRRWRFASLVTSTFLGVIGEHGYRVVSS